MITISVKSSFQNPAFPLQKVAAILSIVVFTLFAMTCAAQAQLFETRAKQAMLVDVGTGSILFSKQESEQIPPASLAKLMTMEVVFNALKTGRLTLTDEFYVSENAWRTGGAPSGTSTMFAELKSSIPLEDLIRGVIVQSANDGCIIIAEGMAGSEATFAGLMNDRARQIGLQDSIFYNSTGLPHPEQKVSIRDLVTLTLHLQREYPDYYKYYSETEFTWNKIRQRNRNPLIGMDIGADGLKTGYTEASGYAIVGSIKQDGRRLVVAMSGLESERERAEESRRMLQWGLRAFEPFTLFDKDEVVGQARLYGGAYLHVPLKTKDRVTILVPLTNRDKLKARITYEGPIASPVKEGQEIATLNVYIGDQLAQQAPLLTAASIAKGPIHRQALDAITELAIGWIKN